MSRDPRVLEARVLIAGSARAVTLVLDDTLSFWGGFDPANGEIVDVHHPQYGQRVAGKVLCIPRSRGSAGTPGGIAETLRNGSGPVAFILGESDVNIGIGALVANHLYRLQVPVLQISRTQLAQIRTGDRVTISPDGRISIAG